MVQTEQVVRMLSSLAGPQHAERWADCSLLFSSLCPQELASLLTRLWEAMDPCVTDSDKHAHALGMQLARLVHAHIDTLGCFYSKFCSAGAGEGTAG